MDWKKLLKKFLYPPVWLIIILAVLSAAALIAVFISGWEQTPVAYAVYVVAFYSLTVLCLFLAVVLPRQYKSIKQKIYDNPLGNRYMTDAAFKTRVLLYTSLTINALYVAVNLFSGIRYGSVWYITLAVYYSILAVMRFLLLRFANRNDLGKSRDLELLRSRLCNIILITLNVALSGVVVLVIRQGEGFEYPGMLIYVMAAYTFYITVNSIVNVVKYRKFNSPVMLTAKIINLAAALVSMLSLETAMLTEFGAETSDLTKNILIGATGAGVSAIVIALAVYGIVRAALEIKEIKRNENGRTE